MSERKTTGPKTQKRKMSAGVARLTPAGEASPSLRLAQEQLDNALGPSREVMLQLLQASERQLAHERERRKALEAQLKELTRAAKEPIEELPDETDDLPERSQTRHLAERLAELAERMNTEGLGARHSVASEIRKIARAGDPLDLKHNAADRRYLYEIVDMSEWLSGIREALFIATNLDNTHIPAEDCQAYLAQLSLVLPASINRANTWADEIIKQAAANEL